MARYKVPRPVCKRPGCANHTKESWRVYCSKRCSGLDTHPPNPRPPCEQCGKPVKQPRHRFCSHACDGASRHRPCPPCEQCGKPTKRTYRKFCSVECHRTYRYENRRQSNLIPVEPLRERFLQLHARGVSYSAIARRLGWVRKNRPSADTIRLKRALGLVADTGRGKTYRQRVSSELAARLAVALDMDPIDIGV